MAASIPLVVAGCVESTPAPAPERGASFQPYSDRQVGSEKLDIYVCERTALVLSDDATITHGDASGVFHVSGNPRLRWGVATAIDRRGYFLTAAHVVDSGPVHLTWRDSFSSQSAWRHAPARIVWKSDRATTWFDFAIVCVDQPLAAAFTWAGDPAVDQPVVAAGYGDPATSVLESDTLALESLGGTLSTVREHTDESRAWIELHTTAPLYFGDSGGPLADLDGRLIAVNTGVHGMFKIVRDRPWYYGIAARPDARWVRSLIDADARSR
jgi:S1-C subfamily serine protease